MPSLLLRRSGLVKTTRFSKPVYLGDPLNVMKIYNDKEVDELVLLDIDATVEGRGPNLRLLSEACTECFMPLAYGGGVQTSAQARQLLAIGLEKVVVNAAAVESPMLIRELADQVGSQSVVVSIDVKRRWLRGASVVTRNARRDTGIDPRVHAANVQALGAGEILLTSVDRDGTMEGYDIEMVRAVAAEVDIPIVACGGAGTVDHFRNAVDAGASAVAAGSMFVFQGSHRGVLISFPPREELDRVLGGQLA
jgi:cyclase